MGPLMGVPLLPLGGGVQEKPMIILDALGVVHGTRREVVAAARLGGGRSSSSAADERNPPVTKKVGPEPDAVGAKSGRAFRSSCSRLFSSCLTDCNGLARKGPGATARDYPTGRLR